MNWSLRDQWVNIILIKCGLILVIVSGFNEQARMAIFFVGLLSVLAGGIGFFNKAK
ncbi:MAG: hypothetical protein OSA24_08510 [Longimicrobiales bacterium]|nr:hypothetical protein [Longimicrobiales bacterium]